MGFGPCMCGDIQCPSCGPAQGNFRCEACGRWADEGCVDPKACAKKAKEIGEAQYRDYLIENVYEKIAREQGKWIGECEISPDALNEIRTATNEELVEMAK